MINRNTILGAALFFLAFGKTGAQSVNPSVHTGSFTGKPQYLIETKRAGVFLGNINIELFPNIAPNHVKNFDTLVSTQFYDSTAFHRVIPGFMIQGGDPNSRHGDISTWGYGDPNQPTVDAEFSAAKHLRGILSAARSTDINSATSQFFICVAPASWLDGLYSIYGHVTSGMDIVDDIVNSATDANDNPLQKIEMFITYTGSNDSVPNAPVLSLPVSGTQNVSSSKQLKWNAVSDAILYHLEISVDSLFSTFFLSKDVAATSYNVTGLNGSNKYYWRVKTNNGGKFSTYSDVWNFSTVFTTSVNHQELKQQGYLLEQIIPNPVQQQATIKYAIPAKEKVTLQLFDAAGREVALLVNEEKEKGEYQLHLDLTKFSQGIYFYRLQAGEFNDTQKLVLK